MSTDGFPAAFAWLVVLHLRYSIAVAYTLQLCEWFTLLPDEIKLIHRSRWSSVKIAYLLCRYYPLVSFPVLMWAYLGSYSAGFCAPVIQPVHALFAPFQVFPQAVMLLRAYAFAGRRRSVLITLSCCFAALVAVSIWVFCSGVIILPEYWYEALGKTGCFANYEGDVMGVRLGMALLTTTLMDLLSLCIVIYHCRQALSSRWALTKYFMGQGLVSFAIVTCVNAVAAILYFQRRSTFSRIGLPFAFTVCNLIACRVILQLREKAALTEAQHRSDHTSKIYSLTVSGDDIDNVELDPWLMDG